MARLAELHWPRHAHEREHENHTSTTRVLIEVRKGELVAWECVARFRKLTLFLREISSFFTLVFVLAPSTIRILLQAPWQVHRLTPFH